MDHVINKKPGNHYSFTAMTVVGSLLLYYITSGFTSPEITMLVTLSAPITLVIGFIYSRHRSWVGCALKTNNDAPLVILGVIFLAPIGGFISYAISRVI
jgi:hypothetical protein